MYLLLLVLLLIVVYLMTGQKSESLTYALGLLTIILIVCANTYEQIEGFTAPVDYKMGPMSGVKLSDIDNLKKRESPSYDGIKLNFKANDCGWRHPPCDVPLLDQVLVTSPVGDNIPLTNDPSSYSFPTTDGDATSPQKMFMLAHNQVSPKCCPSTFSTDRGCVCTTKKQRDYLSSRGGNKTSQAYHDF